MKRFEFLERLITLNKRKPILTVFFFLKAGRISAFDELAQKFFTAAANTRQTILDEARTLAKNASNGADHYLKVMEKVVANGDAYVVKETKRCVPHSISTCSVVKLIISVMSYLLVNLRLGSLMGKSTLAPPKLDELQIKINVLRSFFKEPKHEESKATRDEAEL